MSRAIHTYIALIILIIFLSFHSYLQMRFFKSYADELIERSGEIIEIIK